MDFATCIIRRKRKGVESDIILGGRLHRRWLNILAGITFFNPIARWIDGIK
jgi:hypothetical protein